MPEPQQAPVADPVADVLRAVPAPDAVRHDAWDRYYAATSEGALTAALKDLPLSRIVKAQLADLKAGRPPRDPSFWDDHPNMASLARGTVNTIPAVGALVGGGLTAETGPGAIAGAAFGAGVGRGARDLIAEQTGLDPPTSPLAKAGAIAGDTLLTATAPGVIEAAKAPIRSLAEFADTYRKILPRWAQPQFLADLPNLLQRMNGAKPAATLARPPWQQWAQDELGAATSAVDEVASRSSVGTAPGAATPTGPPVNIDSAIASAKQAVGPRMMDVPSVRGGTFGQTVAPIDPAAATAASMPRFTVQDVKQIKSLIANGATQDEAVAAVMKLRGYPKAWQQFSITSLFPKQ